MFGLPLELSNWRLGIVEHFYLLARVCLLESTSKNVCLIQPIDLSSCFSIVLIVCIGCVYLFACVHTRLQLFGGVLARLAYLSIRVVITQALICLYAVICCSERMSLCTCVE